ncbi:hypothetical protein QAD02_012738 [Eretmocerus hayati]|uniref:Uncharacterized protein n=1 Tax=Eretmocerus hayati TaxID=131215 RepID=A0ACC2P1K5_9HYME|nr:hypothetical protein QAD02_012738 [Eretmocerus hayati]
MRKTRERGDNGRAFFNFWESDNGLELHIKSKQCSVAFRHISSVYLRHRSHVLEAKKEAYPDDIRVTETMAEVDLQSLLQHTGRGIVQHLIDEGVISNVGDPIRYTLIYKGGFDATHVTEFNQKCADPEYDFSHVFTSAIVPLKLVGKDSGRIIWQNETPNSVRFCRPVRFQYLKETDAIDFELNLSKIDGKVCNFLNNCSSQKCFVCKETIGKFNNIDLVVTKHVDETQIKNGLTILHTKIRSMELVLNVAERLALPKPIYRVPKILKPITNTQGRIIQQCLKSRIGVVVNKPKRGFGNTNSGNTSRKFFKNTDIVADITGFSVCLLVRIATILGVISCGEAVNIGAFRRYCIDTAREFVRLYPWYYIPTTLHLLLIHGCLFLRKFDPALGLYSEEPLESSHKVSQILQGS